MCLPRSVAVACLLTIFPLLARADEPAPADTKNSSPSTAAAEPPISSEAKIRRELDRPTKMDFAEIPLEEVVEYLRKQHKIDVELDTAALQDEGLSANMPVVFSLQGVTLRSGLRLLLNQLGLTFVVEDDALLITTRSYAEIKLETRVYPVVDLVATKTVDGGDLVHDYDTLIELITTTVHPHTWEAVGGAGSVAAWDSNLVISQSGEIHGELEALLAALRRVRQQFAENANAVSSTTVWLGSGEAELPGEAEQAIRKKLQERISVQWDQVPLSEAMAFLADKLGLPIVIDQAELEDVGLDSSVPVSVRASNARVESVLRRALKPLGLIYVIDNEVLMITTRTCAEARMVSRLYPVFDLVRPRAESADAASLADAITATIVQLSWDEVGGAGSVDIWPHPWTLVIAQSDEAHQEIEKLLKRLRATKASQPKAEEVAFPVRDLKESELRSYHLPRFDEKDENLDAEKVATLLERMIAALPGVERRETFVGVVGPSVIAVRGSRPVHREAEKILSKLGVITKGGMGGFGGGMGGFGGGMGGGGGGFF